ncbi:MAG: hypothetical protein GY765_15060 [bacterium]|nr:hypothetical protein [bacterium]
MRDIKELLPQGPHLILRNSNAFNLSRVIIAKDGAKYRLNVFSKGFSFHDQNYNTIEEAKEEFLLSFGFWTTQKNLGPIWVEMTLPIPPSAFSLPTLQPPADKRNINAPGTEGENNQPAICNLHATKGKETI